MNQLKRNMDQMYKQHILDVLKEGIEKRSKGMMETRWVNPERIDGIIEGMETVYEMIETGLFTEEEPVMTYMRVGSECQVGAKEGSITPRGK